MNKKLLTIGILMAVLTTAPIASAFGKIGNTDSNVGVGAADEIFLSKEIVADAPFTSAAMAWDEISPPGTHVELMLRFKYETGDKDFSEWLYLDEEVEKQSGKTTSKYALASTNLATGIQYKFQMHAKGNLRPIIKNVNITFLKTVAAEKSPELEKTILLASSDTSLLASSSASLVAASSKSSSSFKIIKRSEWGAKESYRYLRDNSKEAELIEVSPEDYEKYKAELKYSKVVKADDQGDKYIWPLQYPEKVTKFIIHHTATTKNMSNPEQAIRDIYYYHAVTRGWGDIGYNYIIDQKGKIYEGRAGGEGVVGGHAGIGNVGSIGIAVLGNYEEEKVQSKVVDALVELIAQKSKIHNINPSSRSMFRGKMQDNVIGHRDVGATACPGKNLYNKLKEIRKEATKQWKKIRGYSEYENAETNGPDVRVKISFSQNASSNQSPNPQITGDGPFKVYSGNDLIAELKSKDKVTVSYTTKYRLDINGATRYSADQIRFVPDGKTILRIENFEHRPAWNTELNDNEYRGILEVRKVGTDLNVINELPLEYYLKGLGEVSDSEPKEKIKAIMVAARTYAKYYTEKERKFPGRPYDLDDDPNVCQKYLGYGMEKRSKNVTSAVEDTKGEVITYKGNIVKTPYFSQSDGKNTKSAQDVWGWKNAPYLESVSDSYCNAKSFAGHGVGLSGCGAKGMAEKGKKYKDILKHYYTGVEITDLY